MKQKRIKELIENSGVLGFEFDNDKEMYVWEVTPAKGKMLAHRTIESCDDSFRESYFAVPYDDLDACENIYQEMLLDFIGCYAEDLFHGEAGSLALFSDIASRGDDGLMELLSFFDKTYDEFLLDVFYWYGCWVEMTLALGEDGCKVDPGVMDSIRLTKSVLRHLCEDVLIVDYEDGSAACWELAKANGGIWYRRVSAVDIGDVTFFDEEYGCFAQDDEDALSALRDNILLSFWEKKWSYEVEGDPLGLLGIDEVDLYL